MSYLIVENNTITNIIVAGSEFATEIGALPYYDGAQIGGTYAPPPDYGKLRADALQRIDGKCSLAIASGIDYNGKHYSLTETKQGYINNAYLEVLGGSERVKLAADNEDVTWHTAQQVRELFNKATEWGKVCIYYKGYLVEWVKAEADSAVLESIDYGNALPSAYMQTLSAKLAEEGINLADYVEMLNYKDNI